MQLAKPYESLMNRVCNMEKNKLTKLRYIRLAYMYGLCMSIEHEFSREKSTWFFFKFISRKNDSAENTSHCKSQANAVLTTFA